jgi:hypothetical protein
MIILIGIIAIIIIASSIFYLIYIVDYTYEDDRISINVPAQTKFSINASHTDYWTGVNHVSNDKNNISIKILRLNSNKNISLFCVSLDLFGITKAATMKELTENQSYNEAIITENYTVYYNEEKDNYLVLLFDADKEIITIISCDNSSELISTLAISFVLKSFNTNGLKIINIDTNNTSTNTVHTTKKSKEKEKTKYERYVEDAINDPRGDGTKNTAMSEEEFYESGQDKYY